MTLEVVSFILGAILLAVGLLGGGIESKGFKIPKVSRFPRILSVCFGLVFILLALCIPYIPLLWKRQETAMPDLIIESLTHSPETPKTSDTITFTAVVKNIGFRTAGRSTLELKVQEEGVQETFAIPALKPSETYTVQHSLALSVAQEYRSTAMADLKNEVPESNETNNQKTDGYRVVRPASPKLPDLIIESLTHSPETPTTADTITFTVAVKNIGSGKAGRSTLALKVGGETVPKIYSVPALKPGERYRVQRRETLSVSQRYRNTATADIKNEVRESDETNNQKTDDYRVVPPKLPDLIIESLTHSPAKPTTADKITFTIVVKNIGRGTAGPSIVGLKVGGETLPKQYSIKALGPGNTYTLRRHMTLSKAQRYRNTATADIKNEVRESDETNNKKTDVCVVREDDLGQEDCIPYNPRNLRIVNEGARGWLLTDGRSRMLMLDNEADARKALALAKRHTQHCFIGRNNRRPKRKDYIVEYWKGNSGIQTDLGQEDCIRYNPNALRIVNEGAQGWLLTDGRSRMLMLDNEADARKALALAKRHTHQCFIGRNNRRPDRKDYIVHYWK